MFECDPEYYTITGTTKIVRSAAPITIRVNELQRWQKIVRYPIMFHLVSIACRRPVVAIGIPQKIAPISRNGIVHHLLGVSPYHTGAPVQGLDEFFDIKKPNEIVTTGRAWTVADVRRKSFDDIHKLWFVLYKECNLLLTEREKNRRNQRPVLAVEEHRYIKVKRSMAAIKQVLAERQRINDMMKKRGVSVDKTGDNQS